MEHTSTNDNIRSRTSEENILDSDQNVSKRGSFCAVRFAHQIAGHATILKEEKDFILKLSPRTEIEFYENIQNNTTFTDLIPKYYQTIEIDGKGYMKLEDLTSSFSKPNIMDIKMGHSTVSFGAPPKKQLSMKLKDETSTTSKLGFRLLGMEVHKVDGTIFRLDKKWGLSLEQETIENALSLYLNNGEIFRKDIIPFFLEKLYAIQRWISTQTEFLFVSSSILLVYEGDTKSSNLPLVKMIDFAHVFPIRDGGVDASYLDGLNNLINVFEQIFFINQTDY